MRSAIRYRLGAALSSALALAAAAGVAACRGPNESGPIRPGVGPVGRAGAAAVSITPPVAKDAPPVWLAGYGRGRQATGVEDGVEARAFVWDDGRTRIALVALDLVGLFRDRVLSIRRRLAERADLAIGEVVVASTHNHEGPDTLGLWGPDAVRGGVDPAYVEFVEERVVEAIARACARLRPATLWVGEAETSDLVEDSRLPIVKDEVVRVLEARQAPDGRPLATIVLFSSHPEALGPRNRLVSADYPGFLRHAVERQRGGTALFFAGSIGGLLGPGSLRFFDPVLGEVAPRHSLRNAQLYAENLATFAGEALRRARRVENPKVRVGREAVLIPVDNPLYRIAARLGVVRRADLLVDGRPTSDPLDFAEGRIEVLTEVGLVRFGDDVSLLLVPGEIYLELVFGGVLDPADPGADFPDAPAEPPIWPLLPPGFRAVIGLAEDEIGYILPKRQWDERPPFAFGRQEPQYGETNSCGPEAGPRISEAIRTLLGAQR